MKKNIFIIGCFILVIIYLPVLFQNQNFLVTIHDELDGEVLTYVLRARHFLSPVIPEMFNGVSSSSMTPPALLLVMPYCFLRSPTAFFCNYIFVIIMAYTGMFLCLSKLLNSRWIALTVSILFTMLPFYSVYGLSVMGQPLLMYSFCELWKPGNKKTYIPYIFIVLFGLSSSLILVGYADLIVLAVFVLYGFLKRQNIRPFICGMVVLLIVYLGTNWELIAGVLGRGSFITHKSEYIITPSTVPVFETARQIFKEGYYHAASNHQKMIPVIMGTMLLGLVFWKKLNRDDKQHLCQMLILFTGAALIAAFYAVYHCGFIVQIRNQIGGILVEFQADRFYWLYPAIWFLLFGYSLSIIRHLFKYMKWLGFLVLTAIVAVNCNYLWSNSDLRVNWEVWHDPEYVNTKYTSLPAFYQESLFRDIDKYIGKPKESYKVMSVGLYPSIALYNGFYCLDGYSNNYDVEYKHNFREVIDGELEKNDTLRNYYDSWGNRVYGFSNDIPFVYYPSRDSGLKVESLDFDFEKLRSMGCRYIFSAVPIMNCDDLDCKKSFEGENSYYKVYLYELRGK